jgi:hypothetical protein
MMLHFDKTLSANHYLDRKALSDNDAAKIALSNETLEALSEL